MKFFLLLTIGLVELVASLGKWLFIVTAPVLLIVVGSYYQAGLSFVEPLLGLVLVAGIFAVMCSLSARLHDTRLVSRENAAVPPEATAGLDLRAAQIWNLHLEEDDRDQVAAKEEARQANQRQAELWKQANPWGGYNPHE